MSLAGKEPDMDITGYDTVDEAKLEDRLREIVESRREVKVRVARRGQQVGDYRLIEPVGEDATSEVWLAWQAGTGRHVALKILRAGLDVDDVMDGLRALQRSTNPPPHPALVPVIDVGATAAGHPYLVRDFIAGKPFPGEDDPEPLADELLEAVTACHAAGLTHGSLTAGNVLVLRSEGRPRVRILDPDPDGGTVDDDLAAVARLRTGAPGVGSESEVKGSRRRFWIPAAVLLAAALPVLLWVMRGC